MTRAASAVMVALALALFATPGLCDILEYTDADGNVKYYKYTDNRGGVVFSDRLGGIPDEVRRAHKIVRIGPPHKAGRAPAAAPRPQLPAFDVHKAGEPAVAPETGGSSSGKIILTLGVVLAAAVALLVFLAKRRQAQHPGELRTGSPETPARGFDRLADVRDGGGKGRPDEMLQRYLRARDFFSAAEVCESLGRLDEAAGYHREAGNLKRARELYVELKNYLQAAPLFEATGDIHRAAELYEAQFQRESEGARGAAGSDSALKSGRLFEQAGDADRAVAVYVRGGRFADAAAIHERRGDYLAAAELHLQTGDAEKAAVCFEKGGAPARSHALLSRLLYDQGRVREAAEHLEQAGDPMQAAALFQEAGDLSRAGELFLAAGCLDESAESFLTAGDLVRAAEAYDRAGKPLQAAQVLEKAGGDQQRVAALYERAGEFYAAGRILVRCGELDRALTTLQRAAPESEQYSRASLLVGMIFLKKGLTNLAFEKFSKLIGDQPIGKMTLEPYYFLALCHERAGAADQAQSIFRKILAEDYNFRDVRKRVEPAAGTSN